MMAEKGTMRVERYNQGPLHHRLVQGATIPIWIQEWAEKNKLWRYHANM